MLDKKRQINNTIIYLLPIGLRNILPFITLPIFTRILTPDDYGFLGLALIYAIFMSGLANFGMSLGFDRNYFEYSNSSEKLAQLLFSSLVFVMINFTLLFGLTYSFRENISFFLTDKPQHGILILTTFAANFIFTIINNFFFTYLKNEERANSYSKYMILYSLLNFILALILVGYMGVGVIGLVIAQLIAGGLISLLLLQLVLKNLPFSLNKNILAESIRLSYPLTPRIFISVLNTQFDKYMISLLATMGGVGLYHIAKSISDSLISGLMTALQNVFNPQLYRRMFSHHKQDSDSIGRYLTPFLYISILAALSLALFSEEIMFVLTPASYHGAIPIITILAMYFGFLFFGKITGTQLIYSKKTHITSLLTLLSVTINIALNIPMIMKFGAVGAAGATLLAGMISGLISVLVAQHYFKINYEWNKIAWIMGTFFIGATVIAFINLLGAPYLWSLFVKITAMTIFLTLGVKYRVISKENFKEIRSIFCTRNVVTT